MPLPPTTYTYFPVTTRPYATLPTLGHMTIRPKYLHGIVHLPLSFPHKGTQASCLCGHRFVGADLKTQEPGEQLFKLVCVHPFHPSTMFSLHPMLNKRPDNTCITNGLHNGSWIIESHTSATAQCMITPSPNHQMAGTTPSSPKTFPLKNLQMTTSPSLGAHLAQPCA